MGNTKHVSIRLDSSLVDEIDRYGAKVNRSRAYLIGSCLKEVYGSLGDDGDDSGAKVVGGGDGSSVPVLSKAKGGKKQLHPLQSVRDELVGGSGHIEACSHQDHRTFVNGDKHWCSTCKVEF